MTIQRLILGTAQLGMLYGVANQTGRPDQVTATKIIETAWENGVKKFDTAQGYGDCESVLKKAFSDLNISDEVRVISKFKHDIDHLDKAAMTSALESSLKNMDIPNLWGMMIHDETLLEKWHLGIGEILYSFILSNKVSKLGFSVYTPGKALEALELEGVDFVQIPGNVLDRRFERAGVWELAAKKKKQVHIRSIFLQGLILMDEKNIPEKMKYAVPQIDKLDQLSRQFGMSRKELSIGFIKLAYPDSHALFGVDSVEHVRENIASWEKEFPEELVERTRHVFDDVPETITNWNLWPKW